MKIGKAPDQSSLSDLAAILGRRGGQARMIKMTPKARSEVAQKAAEARWSYQRLKSDKPVGKAESSGVQRTPPTRPKARS